MNEKPSRRDLAQQVPDDQLTYARKTVVDYRDQLRNFINGKDRTGTNVLTGSHTLSTTTEQIRTGAIEIFSEQYARDHGVDKEQVNTAVITDVLRAIPFPRFASGVIDIFDQRIAQGNTGTVNYTEHRIAAD